MEFDGLEPTPKKFYGSWNEFESVLSGNVTVPPQGIEIITSYFFADFHLFLCNIKRF